MPSSAIRQINEITELIYFCNPNKILDIGIGCGKYAFLSREYLDRPYLTEKYHVIIHGVEAYKDYIRPIHGLLYDHIYLGDFPKIKNDIDSDYDLILLIDVIEHFDKDAGLAIINFLLEKGKNLIIATPDGFVEQEEVYGNPYEIHRSGWSKSDFKNFTQKFFVNHDAQLIVFIGQDFKSVEHQFGNSNKYVILKKLFPFIKKPYRKLKLFFTKFK